MTTARDTARGAGPPRVDAAPPPPHETGALWPATAFLRRLRVGLEQGAGLAQSVADATLTFPRDARDRIETARRRLGGRFSEDEWGFDEGFADAATPLLDFLYERWWRVETEGVAHVPGHGRALIVANHAGILPWDATMIGLAVLKQHPLPRYLRFLALNWAFELPYVSIALRKLGGVPASPYNAIRLLERDELVGVFPEGVKGTGKPFRDRYRLARFGRGGFAEIALRTGAPIVPVAVVGSEEIYPKLADAPLVARLIGAPFVPITPTFPALGPLGAVPLPSKWRIEFCEPIDVSGYGPEAADDRSLVFELSEHVRNTIQRTLYENLVERGSAFL